jgi:P4 family phage/plasmid primase-like protien
MFDVIDATPVLNPNQGGQHEFCDGHLGDPAQGGGSPEPGQGAGSSPAPEPAEAAAAEFADLQARFEDDLSPDGLAASFAQHETWKYWGGNLLRYTGTHYVSAKDDELRHTLHKHLRGCFLEQRMMDLQSNIMQKPSAYHVTPDKVNAVMAAVKSQQLLHSTVNMPSYKDRPDLNELITLENGLLDLKTGRLLPHTPDYFDLVLLPYKYDPAATCPFFMDNLNRMFADKPDVIPFLQEYFGWVLSPNSDAQVFLYIHGTGGTGKTSLLASLEALVAPQNVAHQCLGELGGEFGIAPLMGKKLNVCSDMDAMDAKAEGVLKRLVDGGTVSMNQKYKDVIDVRLNTRFAFASNKIPRFDDQSTGIYRRFVPIAVETVIDEKNIIRGLDKPAGWVAMGELPGILNWALAGLQRLREQGWSFEIPAVITHHVEEIREENDHMREFLLSKYRRVPDDKSKKGTTAVYLAYRGWCEEHGHDPEKKAKFNDAVRNTFPGIKKNSGRIDGSVLQAWHGLERIS